MTTQHKYLFDRFNRLVHAVNRMRVYQIEYGKHRSMTAYKKMKYWENEVDRIVKEENRIKNSGQQEIF